MPVISVVTATCQLPSLKLSACDGAVSGIPASTVKSRSETGKFISGNYGDCVIGLCMRTVALDVIGMR